MEWLPSAAVAFTAGCAILAVNGYKGRPDVVGIDLGTTYSVIALKTEYGVKVLRDEANRSLVPSMVHFGSGGAIHVGYAAESFLETEPNHVIYNAKRYIGRTYDAPAVQELEGKHGFAVVANKSVSPSGNWFSLDVPGHQSAVSPETVGSYVLRHLLDIAYFNLGHRQITKAVVAVPAKFDTQQRRATIAAYTQANLKVVRIIEEPTAAAVAYGLDKKPDVNYILVYDFGGGTLDVSLLFVNKESVQVLHTHGDDELGGSDFDYCLTSWLDEQVSTAAGSQEKLHEACGEEGYIQTVDSTSDAPPLCAPSYIRQLAESMKCSLSVNATVHESCTAYFPGKGGPQDSPRCAPLQLTVERDSFHQRCSDLFDRVLSPVEALLKEINMDAAEVDEVVLVGGTSRIPRIRSLLSEYFGIDHLNTEIDPDLTVAIGAASIVD
uniref:Uncharacterized protein n=1 Tax=Octactis speculum TaxID=3111310 RepID=A0A7S2H244_9STRA|mmetsp:Transcript_60558/g.83101  ORF Transcript_60558/g.83101 Transcript_60558/m.83101 type:complete len:437 (+) Transcript_60558:30-1340(+)|eukprot:CAMPEP_0185767922 /NCGR_PEP_ID=MMETSP1174-20130828/45765_1 /TAXON_ID=35687 /ORGANISM="Dictyocha speculum, Strain CCMP1381" /LENGTH=436 /DNA_ID=CAMNT_0028452315 /DNA_START=26 /DNA_END=1336 /DNA_ORIENTATION=-